MRSTWTLDTLLQQADPSAELALRHLWLVRATEWLRDGPSPPSAGAAPGHAAADLPVAVAARLRVLGQRLQAEPDRLQAVRGLLAAFAAEVDWVSLLAESGFAPRSGFWAELVHRVRQRVLPATPQTRNLAELLPLLLPSGDAAWLQELGAGERAVLATLWPVPARAFWQQALHDGMAILCSAIRAAGLGSALRLRMSVPGRSPALVPQPFKGEGTPVSRQALQHDPFMQLAACAQRLRDALEAGGPAAAAPEALYLRSLLQACRDATDTIALHLEEYGVSLQVVFEADQLRERTLRVEQILDVLMALDDAQAGAATQRLLTSLVAQQDQRRSVRALFAQHSRQLSRQVAERNAETGEHYITRNRGEYEHMLRAAAGGGAVIAATTFGKFAVGAMGLSLFWSGFFAGLNYAASFVLIMLLHWTVATKQPAMTAPAMAARLKSLGRPGDDELEGFVDEVVNLIRSQVAGIVGNLALCFPLVWLAQWLATAFRGQPLVGPASGEYVLHSLTLLGPTALFAAFTGVLLFASSLIAGWVENAFVLHRLDSALAYNPRIVARLGAARAGRWARWWRAHISGLAANISLGFMLGLLPVVLGFFGLPLEVRHVTLGAGQLAAALGALGMDLLRQPVFWWCVAGIAVTGVLNLAVSFWLAFKVALRARGVRVDDRQRIRRAILRRMLQAPLSFVRPPPKPWDSP